ncbi:MAG TPA: hypothetical protein VMY87_09635 [Armatimonadota bacterium]|nr:hypothetical protein [Armatimonadota bacterium]
MDSKLALKRCSLLGFIPAILLIAVGCAAPKHKPEQFIATWTRPAEGASYPYKLQLLPDGSGVTSGPSDPHPVTIRWYLRRDKLVLAPQDGSPIMKYDCRFNSPDEMVLITEDNFEFAVARAKPE